MHKRHALAWFFALAAPLWAQFGPSPYKVPDGLVKGAAFIDLIRPIPVHGGLETNVWGGANVIPREAHNGLEDAQWSYWCTSVLPGPDGREHMFVCRWLESSPQGHREWPRSRLVHAVADNPAGPFTVTGEIGPGHNAEAYQAQDGTYVVYVIGGSYQAKSLEGPWEKVTLQFDLRGMEPVNMSNLTFTRREDGSVLMVSRTGQVWVSPDGLKPYVRLTAESVYPPIKGAFEDPVVWRDEVQYHLIVNDWFGRTAYYLRSRDGLHWVWDPGKAYDPDVVRHPDGKIEGWHKLERPKVRQDACGRATHLYLAAIDAAKEDDHGSDTHSSKSVALPLTVGRRLAILDDRPITADTREIRLAIRAEAGFDPQADVDVDSLTFGAVAAVNFGKGCKPKKSEPLGKDLVVVFDAAGNGFAPADFAGKLLGKDRRGELLFGYARLPGQSFLDPILAARRPRLVKPDALAVRVENFGQVASTPTALKATIRSGAGEPHTVTAALPAIPPYGSAEVAVPIAAAWLNAGKPCTVELVADPDGAHPVVLKAALSLLAPGRDGLATPKLASAIVDNPGWGQSQADRSIEGKPLRIGSAAFQHGIGTHASSEQVWPLNGAFQWLSFFTGIDRDNNNGTATVQVWADGRRIYETPLLKAGEEPCFVCVPMQGVTELKIASTDGGDGNGGDHVDLCELTLSARAEKPGSAAARPVNAPNEPLQSR